MTALPAATDFTGASITEAQFKTAITSLRAFLSELLGASGTDKVAALTALGAILCDSLDKAGAYTVVATDKGKVINCIGTFTLSLTAAATLGDGFAFSVWNNGSGTITIDPSASETIDGALTKTLAPGKLAIVYCDGTRFVTVGSIATGPDSGLDADTLDGYHATGLPYAGVNNNFTFTNVWNGSLNSGETLNIASNYGYGLYVVRYNDGSGAYVSSPLIVSSLSADPYYRTILKNPFVSTGLTTAIGESMSSASLYKIGKAA